MNIRDVCIFKYPGQVEANNIGFGQDDDGSIFINKWDVAGIEQPTVEELEAEIPQYQRQFDVDTFKNNISFKVSALLDSTAKVKGYDNAYSLIGYVNSSNATWKAEADVFVNWRDSVWEAVFIEYSAIDSGGNIPDEDVFIASLPQIEWSTL